MEQGPNDALIPFFLGDELIYIHPDEYYVYDTMSVLIEDEGQIA